MAHRNLWQLISALFRSGAATELRTDTKVVAGKRPRLSSILDDFPISFGYKSTWIAARTSDSQALADSLGLKECTKCSWADGIANAYSRLGVFVTPQVNEWTIAVGNLPEAGQERFLPYLMEISARFGQVFYFGTHRVVDYQAWAIAEQGQVRRAFGWLGESGEFLLNEGDRTPQEIELGTGVEDFENAPDEETVLTLASCWVLDPRQLSLHTGSRGPGLFAER